MTTREFKHVNTRSYKSKETGLTTRAYYYRPTGERLPDIDDPGFPTAYEAAEKRSKLARPQNTQGRSFNDLVAVYRESPEYKGLADKTRKDYDWYIKTILDLFGDMPVKSFARKHAVALRDKFKEKPSKANYIVRVMRLLCTHAIHIDWIKENPIEGRIALKTKGGHKRWTDEAIAAFREACKGPERIPFEIALYTGQRQADVLKMKWEDIKDGKVLIRQQKTNVSLMIPIHPDLQAYLDTLQHKVDFVAVTANGKPWATDTFRHRFHDAVVDAGLDLTFHGLRGTAASLLAEAGAGVAEIAAVTGHRTLAMVQKYVAGAEQERLASLAMSRSRRKTS